MSEKWTTVSEHNSFMISNHGRIKHIKTNKIRTIKPDGDEKYKVIRLNWKKKKYRLHKLVYKYFGAHDLTQLRYFTCIDHIDGDSLNNHIDNLRPSNPNLNTMNQVRAKGYFKCGKKYRVQCNCMGKKLDFGRYNTPVQAKTVATRVRKSLFARTEKYFWGSRKNVYIVTRVRNLLSKN